ncbi:MAG TPA: NAD(P)H-dependent oxidoreductase [Syntrophomonadaceae bacterium]|nr:NAD(P)H-dependent oxidoreductase [Syntrophomonadaceae bacterium]
MKATVITDKDYQTELFQKLISLTVGFLNDKGLTTEQMNIGRDDLAFCRGCFGCWVKTPGECIIKDMMVQVNRNFMNSNVVIYLSPVIFGQFSANIKNALDRWLPNMLPFFETRPDGSSMHPSRYDAYPQLIIIGYGNALSEEDAQLFIDITKKHRRNVEILVYQGSDRDITEALNKMDFRMVGGHL